MYIAYLVTPISLVAPIDTAMATDASSLSKFTQGIHKVMRIASDRSTWGHRHWLWSAAQRPHCHCSRTPLETAQSFDTFQINFSNDPSIPRGGNNTQTACDSKRSKHKPIRLSWGKVPSGNDAYPVFSVALSVSFPVDLFAVRASRIGATRAVRLLVSPCKKHRDIAPSPNVSQQKETAERTARAIKWDVLLAETRFCATWGENAVTE